MAKERSLKNFKGNNMYFAMDYPGTPLYTQPYLLEFDIKLVEDALEKLHENSDISSKSLAQALSEYCKACNNAFLASEYIRAFLLLSLLVTLIISLIALAMLPVTPLNVALICFVSLILFSVNIFTLFHQTNGYQQETDWTKLNRRYSEYTTEKLYSKDKISSPTSAPCLFPAKRIPQNDHRLNPPEQRLSPIDETSSESNSANSPLISFTK